MTNANRIKTDFLKQTIEALPGNQFTQAWECIEGINAALNKAGTTVPLALAYIRTTHGENTAELAAVA